MEVTVTAKVLFYSDCKCVFSPKDSDTFKDVFKIRGVYRAELIKLAGSQHYRVYPERSDNLTWYTCSPNKFNRYFELIM